MPQSNARMNILTPFDSQYGLLALDAGWGRSIDSAEATRALLATAHDAADALAPVARAADPAPWQDEVPTPSA